MKFKPEDVRTHVVRDWDISRFFVGLKREKPSSSSNLLLSSKMRKFWNPLICNDIHFQRPNL